MSFAALFPNRSRSIGSSSSTTFDGMDPPASTLLKLGLMLCPEGRTVRRKPLLLSRSISLLYGLRTARLSAFGHGVFDSHHTYSTESLIRMRRTVTHSAGIGILAGLNQKHSCASLKPTRSTSVMRSLKWYSERVGVPSL